MKEYHLCDQKHSPIPTSQEDISTSVKVGGATASAGARGRVGGVKRAFYCMPSFLTSKGPTVAKQIRSVGKVLVPEVTGLSPREGPVEGNQ